MVEPSSGVIRFRFTPRQLATSVLLPVIVLAVLALVVGGGGLTYLLGGAMVGAVVVGLARMRAGLDLTEDHAVVRGLVGAVELPWAEVVHVDVSQHGLRKGVVLETAERLYRPLAPVTSTLAGDPAFEDKARTVSAHWREHRTAR